MSRFKQPRKGFSYGQKKELDSSVYEEAIKRFIYLFENFDRVTVAFSGGKDSTALMNCGIDAAKALGRTEPLDVVFYDEEALAPETVEYMERVRSRPEVSLRWICAPIAVSNACSPESPLWYPWAEEDRPLWCREMPKGAITENDLQGFRRAPFNELNEMLFPPSEGTGVLALGVRAAESLLRWKNIATRRGFKAFVSGAKKHWTLAYPIFDWSTDDVWRGAAVFGWDYNRAYDVMELEGIARSNQRVGVPFAAASLKELHSFKTCWPGLWEKLQYRVPGARAAARYGRTAMYGSSGARASDASVDAELLRLGPGETWLGKVNDELALLVPKKREEMRKMISSCVGHHRRFSTDPIPDDRVHPKTGWSWQVIYSGVKVGHNRFNRTTDLLFSKAFNFRVENGITRKDAVMEEAERGRFTNLVPRSKLSEEEEPG